MADWGSGYITDKAYVHDFCRVQTPPMLALAALTGGLQAAGGSDERLAYCDLGCGQGYTANLIAAANPAAQVLGVDFNPSHVANARALAGAAKLSNVTFREASFEDIAADAALPQFDIVAMHGVFSWISAHNRRALVAFIARQLKPGGLLYVSYDCMPGWAAIAPLRSIMARHFAPRPGVPSQTALQRALAYADSLHSAQARFYRMFPHVEAQMDRLKKTPRTYLAHELLTRDWQAFSFGDVAAELAEAKLVYVASAHLTDGVDRINFEEAQQKFLATLDDPILREETRDMLLGRQFRRDVYAKGIPEASSASLYARWLDTRFAMTTAPQDFDMTFETAVGKLQLRSDVHGPMIELLHEGPITLRQIVERSPQPATNWASITDVLKLLIGRGDLQPALPADGDAARLASVRTFNDAVLARAVDNAEFGYLASSKTGGGVRVDRMTQLYLIAQARGLGDPTEALTKLTLAARTGENAATDADAVRDRVGKEIKRIEIGVVPTLKKIGAL